jgi:hypothetical protein
LFNQKFVSFCLVINFSWTSRFSLLIFNRPLRKNNLYKTNCTYNNACKNPLTVQLFRDFFPTFSQRSNLLYSAIVCCFLCGQTIFCIKWWFIYQDRKLYKKKLLFSIQTEEDCQFFSGDLYNLEDAWVTICAQKWLHGMVGCDHLCWNCCMTEWALHEHRERKQCFGKRNMWIWWVGVVVFLTLKSWIWDVYQ